jgi:hypothetical protein
VESVSRWKSKVVTMTDSGGPMYYANQAISLLFMLVAAIVARFAWMFLSQVLSWLVGRPAHTMGAMAFTATFAEDSIILGGLFILIGVGMIVLQHSQYVRFLN